MALGRVWYSSFQQTGLIPLLSDAYSKRQFNQFQFGEEFRKILDDPQHFKAMSECFGSDYVGRATFFWGLYAADVSAKFAAWAMDLLMVRLLWYGGQAVWAAGYAQMPQRLMWFRVIIRLADRDRTIVRKLGNPALLVAVLSSLVLNFTVGDKRVQEKVKLDQIEAENKELQESVHDLEVLQASYKNATDPNERQVIAVMIDQQLSFIAKIRAQIRSPKAS